MIKNHVCSLQSAKRLVELGVKVDSFYYWCEYTHSVETENGTGEIVTDWLLESKENVKRKGLDVGLTYPALLASELGEMLPSFMTHNGHAYTLTIHKSSQGYGVYYAYRDDIQWYENDENIVQAMADELILLLESGVITSEQVNKK